MPAPDQLHGGRPRRGGDEEANQRRALRPRQEIASAIAFLAHPDSPFINGKNLTVDGDWNA